MTNTNTPTPTDEPRCVICGVPLGPFEPDPLDLTRCFSHGPSNLGAAAPKPVLVEAPPESCDECGIGQMRLIAGLPLPPDVATKVAEADRLRKLFDDAGEGQYNVLNLVESYQRDSMEADERLRAAESEIAAARAAVGEAWFVGGVSLAEAIARKCQRLEELGGEREP